MFVWQPEVSLCCVFVQLHSNESKAALLSYSSLQLWLFEYRFIQRPHSENWNLVKLVEGGFWGLLDQGHWTGWSQELLYNLNESVILGDFTPKGSSSATVIITLKNH